ncbi:hypothetical protein JXA84_09655 [candidate division WOR-3 bacterium]|nr:hypothetical protein [candidate division WOR-3 bacterium]
MSISNEIFLLLEENPELHYMDIHKALSKAGFKVKPGTVNALMSQDRRFESDGNGYWRINTGTKDDIKLKEAVKEILEEKKKPMFVQEISTCLINRGKITSQESFTIKKVLVDSGFYRWGTSDYFAAKKEFMPTSSIGEFFSEKITDFLLENKLFVHRNDLARHISENTGIYINPDGGFYAELSRLTKKNIVRNIGKSILASEEKSFKHFQSNVTEMIQSVFVEKQRPLLLRELKDDLRDKFGMEFKDRTISAALSEDKRFASARRGFWHLKKWEYEKSRTLYQPGTRKFYTTNPVSEKSLKEGYLILKPVVYEFFPDNDTQIILEIGGKKMLVEYDFSKKRLLNAQSIIRALSLEKGDVLNFTLKDIKLKVYLLTADKKPGRKEDESSTQMRLPKKSSERILFPLRDLLDLATNRGETGFVFSFEGALDVCKMLESSKRKVKFIPLSSWEKMLSGIVFEQKRQEYDFIRRVKKRISEQQKIFTEVSKKYLFTGKKCPSCGSEMVVYRHPVGNDGAQAICSNTGCSYSSLRKAVSIKFTDEDFIAFKEILDSLEKNGGRFYDEISLFRSDTTRNKLSVSFILGEIDKIEDKNEKLFFLVCLMMAYTKKRDSAVLSDFNLFSEFYLSFSYVLRSFRENLCFQKTELVRADFAVAREQPLGYELTEAKSRLISNAAGFGGNYSEPYQNVIEKNLKNIKGKIIYIRKKRFQNRALEKGGLESKISENFREVKKIDNVFEGDEIVIYES